jgi:hypothetical protein
MDVREIVERSLDTYRTCSTYADEGMTEEVLNVPGNPLPYYGSFETRFIRSAGFRYTFRERFPFSDQSTTVVLCSDNHSWRLWDSGSRQTQTPRRLDDALEAILLSSRGASLVVPPLLLRSNNLSFFNQLSDLTREGDEDIQGVTVCRISCTHPTLGACLLWIDQRTSAIHRIRHVDNESTFSFSPRLNEPLAGDQIAFDTDSS